MREFHLEDGYQRHTKSLSLFAAAFAISSKAKNYAKGAEGDAIAWIVIYKKNLPNLRFIKK